MLRIKIFGPLQVIGSDGGDRTPPTQKARALIAILLASASGRCSRASLMDRLWSASAKPQAQASLRQCLRDVRRSLGDEVVVADPFDVWLDLSKCTVDDADTSPGEYLEGIDIDDPEFADWLRLQRSHHDGAREPPPVRGFGLRLDPPVLAGGEADAVLADALVDAILVSLVEDGFTAIDDRRPGGLGRTGRRGTYYSLALRTWLARDRDEVAIRIALVDLAAEEILLFRRLVISVGDLGRLRSPELAAAINAAVSAIWNERERAVRRREFDEGHPDAIRAAVDDIFALGSSDLARAERELRGTLSGRQGALAASWLAILATFRVGQRHIEHSTSLHDEARALTALALERDPNNCLVLALCGHVQSYLLGDRTYAADLFARALKINPTRALAWDLFAMLQVYSGQPRAGLGSALHARELALTSPYRYYFETSCLIAASLSGRHDVAVAHGEAVLAARPEFNSALRFLAASHGHSGDRTKATAVTGRLMAVEPTLSIESLRAARYPVLDTSFGPYFIDGLRKAGITEQPRCPI